MPRNRSTYEYMGEDSIIIVSPAVWHRKRRACKTNKETMAVMVYSCDYAVCVLNMRWRAFELYRWFVLAVLSYRTLREFITERRVFFFFAALLFHIELRQPKYPAVYRVYVVSMLSTMPAAAQATVEG